MHLSGMNTHRFIPFIIGCFVIVGCNTVPIESAPCPCADGFVCCAGSNTCVSDPAMCMPGSEPDAAPGGVADAAPIAPETDAGSVAAAAFTIYLDFDGATVTSGPDDSSIDRSSVVRETTTTTAFSAAPFSTTKSRAEVITDIRDGVAALYAPFDVEVVHQRPASGDYVMALVGGKPASLGLPGGAAGIAPFDCSLINRAIVYVFSDQVAPSDYDAQLQWISATIAQEVAHAYGLEHVSFCSDVMYSLGHCSAPSFRDFDSDCQSGACTCSSGATQNSFALLAARLGLAP